MSRASRLGRGTEQLLAWLRLSAVALLVAQGAVGATVSRPLFVAVSVLAVAYACATIARAHAGVGGSFPTLTLLLDVALFVGLAGLLEPGTPDARWAYLVVPVLAAFSLETGLTLAAGGAALTGFLVRALAEIPGDEVILHSLLLLWLSLASAILGGELARRALQVDRLAATGVGLVEDALLAEERQRRVLAGTLHDNAIQNVLSARLELEEAADAVQHPALARAQGALAAALVDLRRAIFGLHPDVADQMGLEAALRAAAEETAAAAGFEVELEVRYRGGHPHERLLLPAARELLRNVGRHASASRVTVQLVETADRLVLEVVDDGHGFDAGILAGRLAAGHMGLATQHARLATIGGTLKIDSRRGTGTRARIELPVARADRMSNGMTRASSSRGSGSARSSAA